MAYSGGGTVAFLGELIAPEHCLSRGYDDEQAEQPSMIEPADPGERREFDRLRFRHGLSVE